ncbi:hypothetical protein [Ruminococcus sp.]|uniref:WXG100 family type VII secretion target n=1 Tax=Ruminococcus sp. TaxID=41978 RepID=UPI002C1633B4|nr:hypothetical protein [Ruminococcus sp.]HNZ99223.1 hypothetical protein [Ruminococcus sp.]HOH86499.1 hypothetical protein [Ruminococcus sp.]
MAGCRIVNESVANAVMEINGISKSYKDAGDALISALTSAIADMEGEAKDAFQTLIDGDIKSFVSENLPEAVKGMADLLEQNRQQFEDVDAKIAESISG